MSHLRNLGIAKKLTLSFALVILLFGLGMAAALTSINMVSGNMTEFYNKQFQSVQKSNDLKTDLQNVAKCLGRVSVGSMTVEGRSDEEAAAFKTEKVAELKEAQALLNEDLAKLNTMDITSKDELAAVNDSWNAMETQIAQMLALYEEGETLQGLNMVYGSLNDRGTVMSKNLDTVITVGQEEATEKYDNSQKMVQKLYLVMSLVSIVLLTASVILCVLLTRIITNPLHEMEKAAKKLSQGELNQEISYESTEEIGSLAHSLRSTISSLKTYVHEIDLSMEAIGNGKLNYKSEVEFKGDFHAIKKSMDNIRENLTNTMIQINTSADQVMEEPHQHHDSNQHQCRSGHGGRRANCRQRSSPFPGHLGTGQLRGGAGCHHRGGVRPNQRQCRKRHGHQ